VILSGEQCCTLRETEASNIVLALVADAQRSFGIATRARTPFLLAPLAPDLTASLEASHQQVFQKLKDFTSLSSEILDI